MHIKIDKYEFLNGIKIIETGIYKNKIKPWMEGMKIKVTKNSVTLIATNLDFIIEHKIKCEILNTGTVITKIAEIKDFLKYTNHDTLMIEIYLENDNIVIKSDNQEFRTNFLDKAEFPDYKIENSASFVFDKMILLPLLEKSKICASQSQENLAVNCLRLEIEDHLLKLISTDTYRMLYLEKEIDDINSNKDTIATSIPLNTINALIKISKINSSNLLTFNLTEDKVIFKVSNTSIISRIINIDFPDYKSIIQNTITDKTVILKRLEFIRILKQLIPIAKKNYEAQYRVILNFLGNILNLKSDNNISSISSSLLCQKSGEDLKISLNSKYLLVALQNINSENIEMNLSNSKSLVLIKEPENEKNIYLTMPLAIRE